MERELKCPRLTENKLVTRKSKDKIIKKVEDIM